MKFLIASDLHGSAFFVKKLIKASEREKADKLIILGDIYNHGPRNPLPTDYNPMVVAKVLNGIKDKLIVIKGNCDSQVDTMISDFDFIENACIVVGNKTAFLTHGHVYNENTMPKTQFDMLVYGHFHTGFIKEKDGVIIANAGSVSLPKEKTVNSYLILAENELVLKDIEGKIIDSKSM